jgi:hypothetical protein
LERSENPGLISQQMRLHGLPPDCAIGRRFAPTRWLHPGYELWTKFLFVAILFSLV